MAVSFGRENNRLWRNIIKLIRWGGSTVSSSRRRLGWAALLARVFAVDVTRWPTCGGRLFLVGVLCAPASIRRYLSGVGLAAAPAAIAAARPPPQHALDLVV